MSIAAIQKLGDQIHLSLVDEVCEKLEQFLDLLIKKNQELNLTAEMDRPAMRVKHIIDSLMVARFLEVRPGMMILDLGTGGGLPGIPLAILFPEANFVLMDATEKKMAAVQEFITELALPNAKVVTGRAEELAHNSDFREEFDRVLARAVAPLRVLVELAYPFVHLNGKFIAYKGPDYVNELANSGHAFEALHAESPQVKPYSLPNGMGERAFIIVPKLHQTPPHYPRRDGMPAKRPL
ncbi:MAG: 16S rRNA (guanine(527)-N(7))-methyltransferase RsmG [Candidatus Peregrinibacteria bacterium]